MKRFHIAKLGILLVVFILTFQNCSRIDLNISNLDSPNDQSSSLDNGDDLSESERALLVTDFSKLELKNTTTGYFITDNRLKVNDSYLVRFPADIISSKSILDIEVSEISTAQCSVQRMAASNAEFSGSCSKAGKLIINLSLKQGSRRDIAARREFDVEESNNPNQPQDPSEENNTITYVPATTSDLGIWGYVQPKTISETDGRLLANLDAEVSYYAFNNGSNLVKNLTLSPSSTAQCQATLLTSSPNSQSIKKYKLSCSTSGEITLDLEIHGYPLTRYQHKILVVDSESLWNSIFLPRIGYSGFTLNSRMLNPTAKIDIDSNYSIDTAYMNYYNTYMEQGLYAPSPEAATKVSAEIVSTIDRSDLTGIINCEIKNTVPNLKSNGVLSIYCEHAGKVKIRYTYQLLNGSVSKELEYDLY